MSFTRLSQRDPRWSATLLGNSTTSTVGQYGCLLTAFTMLAGMDDPRPLNTCLRSHGGFIQAYMASFDISQCAPNVKCLYVSPKWVGISPPQASIDHLLTHLRTIGPAVIEVDSIQSTPNEDQHFVLATATDGDNILIHDPYTGDEAALITRYGKTYGWAIWRFLLYRIVPVGVPPVVVVPPATTTGKALLGVNAIGNIRGAEDIANRGCKALVVMDDPDVAVRIKVAHPDAVVVSRRWTDQHYTGQQHWDKWGAAGGGVINEIYNEQDGGQNYGTVDQIRDRINNEMEYYRLARAQGALVAFGGYSMGTPDYNNALICEQMKRYAPFYNSDPGCYFTIHNYSPNLAHIDNVADLIWYETRYHFLFSKCGFNPNLRKLIMTETGVDQMGTGGFGGIGATAAQFRHWCDRYMQIMAKEPAVLASMIFCFTQGTNPKWAGFDVGGWESELSQAAGW